jgi:predicted RecA/RadA family phage recombinase
MKNRYAPGFVLDYTIPSATTITAGQVVVVGALVGIAVNGGTTGDVIAVNLTGAYELAKASGEIAIGAKVYWDSTNTNVTTTATGNTFIGNAYKAAASGDATCYVVIGSLDSVGQAGVIAALGTTTNLTAIAASYADLAAARVSVNTLRTDVEARLDAIEAKVDALIAALKAANLMASS